MSRRTNAPAGGAASLTAPQPWRAAAAAGIAVVAAILAYTPALRNGFVWDDPIVLDQLRAIRSWRDLIDMPPIIPKFYYRPVVFVSYLIDYSLGGGTPYWFHLSVVSMHALNTALVALLARRLWGNDWTVAGCAALLFAVHPVHTESVAWMAGRSDVLLCTFLLGTVLLAGRHERMWTAAAAGGAFFLALGSKETAIAALVLVPLADYLQVRRLLWLRYVPLLVATAIYFALRHHNIGAFVGGTPTPAGMADVVRDFLAALGVYSFQTIVPVALSPYSPHLPAGISYLAAGVVTLFVGTLAAGWGWSRGSGPLTYLVAWFFLTLAPSLLVIVRRSASALIADRYLYAPSVAACLLVAWALLALTRRWKASDLPAMALTAGVAALFILQTRSYTRVWTDNLSFWRAASGRETADALPLRELGIALLERNRLQEAEEKLLAAAALPENSESRGMTLSNLASLYRRQGRIDEAIHTLERAIAVAPPKSKLTKARS